MYMCACVYENRPYTSAYTVIIIGDEIWLHLESRACIQLYMVVHHISQNVKAQLIAVAVDEGSCSVKKSPLW